MQKLTFLVVIALIALGSISCNLLTVEDEPSEYPTIYPRLEMSELQEMNSEYHQANDGRLCSTLNEYGLTGFSKVLFEDGRSTCQDRDVVRIEMNNTDTLESSAKKSLIKNTRYTGVEDTASLRLLRMEPLAGCIICEGPDQKSENIEWKLTFDNQVIDSVEVQGTEIIVILDALGVSEIWGNWYPEFNVPAFVNFGYMDVQEGMKGWEIDMRNYTGEETIYTVQEQDVTERPYKVYLPVENEKGLQIRTCWAVPISNSTNENFKGWFAYVDIKEGFLVDLVAR
ncbi:MAG: hypothetical protein MK198_06360 [Gracilimonas sp.]|uniref:hypothetical protein n=1 Tax=Gracilimonas sp. TaxID=1974203 RepID=UPI003752F6CC|nr:hypothetical protein [Gracilimonas sp.]